MNDQNFEMMRFNLPKEQSSIIKVIGVGGGGSNAVNYMYEQGIKGVDFIVCNTDSQALDKSPVPVKVQLGATLTEGRGAGSLPEVGENAAVETLDELKAILTPNTTMAFITAGMGGGTGTGAAPVIARAAKELGILTVGIVTIPFEFEGKKRKTQADAGLSEMRDAVDTLLVITNDKLRELYGNLSLKRAFHHADEVLCTAAKGIAEVITLTGEINVDMNDVNTVMRQSGVAIMGSAKASGEGRAMLAVQEALESPLLNDNDITGANFVLLNITYGTEEVRMDEISEITDHIQDAAGMTAEVIWGYGEDETLGDELCVTIIATGFQAKEIDAGLPGVEPETKKFILNQDSYKEITQTIENPVETPTDTIKHVLVEESEEPFIKSQSEDLDEELPKTEETVFDFQPNLFNEISVKDEPTDTLSHEELESQDTPQLDSNDEEKKYYTLGEDNVEFSPEIEAEPTEMIIAPSEEKYVDDRPSRDVLVAKNKDRERRIKDYTHKMKTPSGLSDLENEPAFKRRNVDLDDAQASDESTISKFTLSEETDSNGETRAKLKDNNSFLHDNVD